MYSNSNVLHSGTTLLNRAASDGFSGRSYHVLEYEFRTCVSLCLTNQRDKMCVSVHTSEHGRRRACSYCPLVSEKENTHDVISGGRDVATRGLSACQSRRVCIVNSLRIFPGFIYPPWLSFRLQIPSGESDLTSARPAEESTSPPESENGQNPATRRGVARPP